jgi:hypothetical protein
MTLEEFYRIVDAIVANEKECKIFLGARGESSNRYYRLVYGINGPKSAVSAHRLILQRKLGRPIKPGYLALHTCDEKSCVEETHLYEGTPSDNQKDRVQRNYESFAQARSQENLEHLKRVRSPKKASKAFADKIRSDPEFYDKISESGRKKAMIRWDRYYNRKPTDS